MKASKEFKMKLQALNWVEIGRYLALIASGNDLRANNLAECIPKRLTGASLRKAGRVGDQGDLFTPAEREPTEREQRAMLGLCLSIGTHKCLANHFYTFEGKTFKQTSGGSIGTEIAGEIAGVYMNRWDQKLLKKLKTLGVRVSQMIYSIICEFLPVN